MAMTTKVRKDEMISGLCEKYSQLKLSATASAKNVERDAVKRWQKKRKIVKNRSIYKFTWTKLHHDSV